MPISFPQMSYTKKKGKADLRLYGAVCRAGFNEKGERVYFNKDNVRYHLGQMGLDPKQTKQCMEGWEYLVDNKSVEEQNCLFGGKRAYGANDALRTGNWRGTRAAARHHGHPAPTARQDSAGQYATSPMPVESPGNIYAMAPNAAFRGKAQGHPMASFPEPFNTSRENRAHNSPIAP
ncbi:hypothetical protein, partial [Streptomyces sp. NPDC088847]|uniref:hypothetical protein n=1 Tax=Streptomyces sp. NPDC088847 TaxID=3365909 RepID=UPI0037F383C2